MKATCWMDKQSVEVIDVPDPEILNERDATITALSRSDPQSGAILGNTLMRLRGALGETGGASAVAAPSSTDPRPE